MKLRPIKGVLLDASERAAREIRSCEDCDARCCKVGLNSMLVSRIEAAALARRLSEPDLATLLPEILEKARREVELRGLEDDDEATYDCPLLSPEGRCMVHGPAQPAGCLTFRPVSDGGCDHDFDLFHRENKKILAAEKKAFRKVGDPLPIPVALLRACRESS